MEIGIISVPKAILYELSYEKENTGDQTLAADEVLSGWAVGILERRGHILKVVTHYGYEGLLDEDVLRSSSGQEIRRRDERQECFAVTGGRADLMSIPSVRGVIRETLFAGSFVAIKEDIVENGYRKVLTAAGNSGFIPLISIAPRKDSDTFLYGEEPWEWMRNQRRNLRQEEETFRTQVTECAGRYLGTQYRWSGKTVDGIDCSGMTFMCYLLCGVLIYRDAKIMEGFPVKEIPVSNIKKGDLLYFPGHIAMYLGDNQYIHSTGYQDSFGCVINSLSPGDRNYREDLVNKLVAAGSIF